MKINFAKITLAALVAVIGVSIASPAHADWYDRHHRFHHGYPPRGYVLSGGYYYPPGYVVAAPAPVVVSPPPPVIVAAPPPPPPVVYAQPAYVAPAPVGLSLGVHIR